jgi:L-lysine exporter family protein LysE/ArgO
MRGGSMETRQEVEQGLKRTLALTLAVTLLNPHVYLDTVVLMGSVSGQFQGELRYLFGLGAFAASATWFLALSLGGQALAPLFSRDVTWRVLDGAVCLTMWSIAASLIHRTLTT